MSATEKEINRRISLGKDFLNWRRDDILYSAMITRADYYEPEKLLYLDVNEFNEIRNTIMEICGYSSRNSPRNNIEKWKESGLIEEKEITVYKNTFKAFVFKNCDDKNKYQLVNGNMLAYLTHTSNKHAIMIYAYLLNKFNYKKGYEFTLTELRAALGYSSNKTTYKSANEHISDILDCLSRQGIIETHKVYKCIDGRLLGEYMSLDNVAEKVDELPQVDSFKKKKKKEEIETEIAIPITSNC